MTNFFRRFLILACLLLCVGYAHAQQQSIFDPHETFKQVNYPSGNFFRSATGRPGSQYWQNKGDYQISASFDTVSRKLTARMDLTYFNNSPDVLQEIWLSLGQNRFRKDSRVTALTPVDGSRFGIKEFTDGFVLERVMIKDKKTGMLGKVDYKIMNDQLKIILPTGLKAKGQISLTIAYHFTLPHNGSDFMGILPTSNGAIYQFSAWFPRIVVYDEMKGWNTANTGYYLEPGKLDYKITLPSEMIVQGTGKLLNPEQVLTKVQLARLNAAAKSNQTVQIRTAKEVNLASSRPGPGLLTWHFSADNSGDGLFAVSKSFIWDAVKVDLPNEKTAMAMSLYPVESNYATWQQSAQTMKQVLESYSKLWCPYPYTTAVNIAGSVTGIGGPGSSFIHYKSDGMANGVWSKINHELGHTWFDMMVAGNGRQGWMVEGLNSFINHVNGETLKGETAFLMADAVDWLGKAKPKQAVVMPYELMQDKNFALLTYVKPAVALNLLRTQVLGKERFDGAFREFINAWKFKHPSPSDFFRCMETASGEDLSWFWQSWFLNDWTLDQSIESVKYVNEQPEKGVNIKLVNKGKMVMPTVVEIIEFNGQVNRISLPAEVWQKGSEWTFHYPSTSTVISVKIDPDHCLPDQDLINNSWHGNTDRRKIPEGMTAEVILDHYFYAIGGRAAISKLKSAVLKYGKEEEKATYVLERSALFPDKYTIELSFLGFAQPLHKYSMSGEGIKYETMGYAAVLGAKEVQQVKQTCRFFPEMDMNTGKHQVRLADSIQNLNGTDVYVLLEDEHTGAGRAYYYDVETGLKMKEDNLGNADPELPYASLEMAEYKPVNGVMLPHTLIIKRTGENEALLKKREFKLIVN